MGRFGHAALHFGRSEIEMTPRIRAMVREVVSLLEDFDTAENFDGTLFELTDACFEQSWRRRRRLAALLAARRRPSSTSGCANRSF